MVISCTDFIRSFCHEKQIFLGQIGGAGFSAQYFKRFALT